MRGFSLIPLALLAACSLEDGETANEATPPNGTVPSAAPVPEDKASEPAPQAATQPRWQMMSSGEGSGLVLAGDARVAQLFCPAGEDRLLVNIPGFDPVASEERMSFGAAGTVVALVADPEGDPLRGGVSGEGPVPVELSAILGSEAGVAINYGYQNAGPFPPIPETLAANFRAACTD